MAVRGLRHLTAGTSIGGQSDRESLLAVNENYLLEALNIMQYEKGIWKTRGGFTSLGALVSPTGAAYTSQFDYQSSANIREHLGVVGTTITKDGAGQFNLSSSARGRWIFWSINNIAYYFNGTEVIRYDGVSFRSAGLAAPSSAPTIAQLATGGSLSAGAYLVRVTFVSDVKESSPSAASNSVTVNANDRLSWTSIPLGPAGTISRNLYRTRAGGSVYYFEQTISDNQTTTATSSIADSSLAEALRYNQDDPPKFRGADIFNDHLFVWGHSTDQLAFSRQGEPETFEPDDLIEFTGKVGDVTGGIVRGINYRGKFYVFRRDSISFIMGNNRDDFITSVNTINFGPIGAIAQDSFQVIEGLLYFLSEDGPYVFDGNSAPRYIGGNTPSIWDPYHLHSKLNQQKLDLVQSLHYRPKKQYWLAIPDKNQTKLSAIYVYNYQQQTSAPDTGGRIGAWSRYESSLFPLNDMTIVEGTSGNREDIDRVLIADDGGNIFEHDTSNTDNGTAIDWRLTTVAMDFDSPFSEKRWLYFTPFLAETQWGSEIIVEFLIDGVGLYKKVYSFDAGSDVDASSLWGQQLWGGEQGYWTMMQGKPVIKPIPINLTGKTLHVMLRGTTRMKLHGFDVAAQITSFRDMEKGTIKARVRV